MNRVTGTGNLRQLFMYFAHSILIGNYGKVPVGCHVAVGRFPASVNSQTRISANGRREPDCPQEDTVIESHSVPLTINDCK